MANGAQDTGHNTVTPMGQGIQYLTPMGQGIQYLTPMEENDMANNGVWDKRQYCNTHSQE